MLEPAVAWVTASLLTLFDLDRTFYIPARTQRKIVLYAWWWGFILVNGALAAALYPLLKNVEPLKSLQPGLAAVAVGASYLALVRIKLTTFTYQGKEVPFGLEALYEAAKGFVYKRINRIAMEARSAETLKLADEKSLAELATQAKLSITQNAILPADERQRALAWLLSVLQDTTINDVDKRVTLADYILSGQRGGA